MRGNMAETVAEAEAQQFRLPEKFENWRSFAGLLDGYKIAAEMGLDLPAWGREQQARYQQNRRWDLSVLELRLMLFYQFRADYWTGYDYHERDAMVDDLLRALSKKTGQPYPSEQP